MGRLTQAIEAAERRKAATLSDDEDDELTASLNFTTETQSRQIISGFDIDFKELRILAHRAGRLFAEMALDINLTHSHEAAWTEGLLVGLFVGLLPPAASESGDTEVTGSEG